MPAKSEPTRWVVGRYEGEQADTVLAHMYAGLGYFKIKEDGRGKNKSVVVAFRQSANQELPVHLGVIKNINDIEKLNKRELSR